MQSRTIKLGEMLTSLIERGGYSRNRQSIVEAVGVSPAALSQYALERTRPSFEKLTALADFFGVSLDYLVYGEPTAPLVDQGPLARYVDHALADVQARASRHSDLLTRIGRVLADRIDVVARDLANSETAGREGLIQHDEILRVERYCRRADIVTLNLGLDVIHMTEGDAAAGQFLHVVAANLAKGCIYRFIVPAEQHTSDETVTSFRSLLTTYVASEHVHERCAFRRTTLPIIAAAGLYQLDAATLELEEPALFTQFSKYVTDDHCLGYLTRPNADSNADMLMSAAHAQGAREAFESLWLTSVEL